MTYLEQLSQKAYKLDLSSLHEDEKKEIKASFQKEEGKREPSKLSDEAQKHLETAINDSISKF